MTNLVLTFYNQVAGRVGSKVSDKIVCGYIYSDYLYPPSKGIPAIAPNLFLVIAPSINYGYRLYHARARRDFDYLLKSWAAATGNLSYYDLPVTHEQSIGAPNPTAIELLRYIYPRLVKFGYKGIYVYGTAWGQGALTNYLLAKLNWNPAENIDELTKDFYMRAYGPKAAPVMQRLFEVIDIANKKFHLSNSKADWRLTSEGIRQIYVANLPVIEKLYTEAAMKTITPAQKTRLEMFETAMAVFYQYLLKNKFIKPNPRSPFLRNNRQISNMLQSGNKVAKLALGLKYEKQTVAQITRISRVEPVPAISSRGKMKRFFLRGPTRVLLYATRDNQAVIRFPKVRLFGESAKYQIRDVNGRTMTQGLLMKGLSVDFRVKAGTVYYLDVISKKSIYFIKVRGCRFAIKPTFMGKNLHFSNKLTPLYFWLPERRAFSVTINSPSLKETGAAVLYDPSGAKQGAMDTSGQLSATLGIDQTRSKKGFWCLAWKRPRQGNVDDIYLQFGGIEPWVVTDPDKPLKIKN